MYRSGHNEAVLKTVWVQAHVGSNPTLSAISFFESNNNIISFGSHIQFGLSYLRGEVLKLAEEVPLLRV